MKYLLISFIVFWLGFWVGAQQIKGCIIQPHKQIEYPKTKKELDKFVKQHREQDKGVIK